MSEVVAVVSLILPIALLDRLLMILMTECLVAQRADVRQMAHVLLRQP